MFTLACKDMGLECAYVAKGNTIEEAIEDLKRHGVMVHKKVEGEMTPELLAKMKQLIKES